MLRPPSIQRQYDEFYSRDPALLQPPPNATPKELEDHATKIRVARETGDWTALLVAGETPTKFVMRPLSGALFRRLSDRMIMRRIGPAELNAYAFRAALVEIPGWPTKLEREQVEDFGSLVAVDLVDELEHIDPRIVTELGAEVIRRARGPTPKS
jgi:hypothetical protein